MTHFLCFGSCVSLLQPVGNFILKGRRDYCIDRWITHIYMGEHAYSECNKSETAENGNGITTRNIFLKGRKGMDEMEDTHKYPISKSKTN